MMTTENADLFEVTCEDCGTTKSYFTAQGVGYFKLNHEGHRVKVREPTQEEGPAQEEQAEPPRVVETVEEPVPEVFEEHFAAAEAPLPEPEPEPEQVGYSAPARTLAEDRVRLGNLVVDVVDEGSGRSVKVFGIANGRERFTKAFEVNKIDELNGFLESGVYYDGASELTYTWTPDKVDLSMDVVKIIDEAPAQAEVQQAAPEPIQAQAQESQSQAVPKMLVPARGEAQTLPEGVLLGKRGYIQEGDAYAQESIRVSKALRKFRWNTEPPYVIGAMFDDLMCVQAQTGMIKSSLIEEVKKLGYTFVAIEAPGGTVTAWFKKNGPEGEQEVLEFHAPGL